MIKKTGFSQSICDGCAYCSHRRCSIANRHISSITQCPEGYTHELMRDISNEINRRLMGLPHTDFFAKEW